MDTKRSQSLRKVATPQASKTRVPPKTQSQASMTPSQAEAVRLANSEKNPLDALSRATIRQKAFERRSGLQDIDEEYLKRMTMPPIATQRPEHAAGKRTPQSNLITDTNLGRADQQPQQQQQAQQQIAQEQMMAQAQIQQQQGAMPNQQMAPPAPINSQPMQAEVQQQQQQQQIPQQVNYMPAAGEPELCTTCPNCQTTIYLARVPEGAPIPAGMHGQPEGPALTAMKQ